MPSAERRGATSIDSASVVVISRNRPQKLRSTVEALRGQTNVGFEIVVVDDGSTPAITVPPSEGAPRFTLKRTEGVGRSEARNLGARAATGELLLFVDDDILVQPDFVNRHLDAHREWSDAMATGAIRLPPQALSTPFGRFRQQLENRGLPLAPGPALSSTFCAAGNMSMARRRFLELQGFNAQLSSAEDQDLALRHCASGGRTLYVPDAVAIHCDDALDIRSYCRRVEWGARELIPFLQRHPHLIENEDRHQLNGPVDLFRDAAGSVLRKVVKSTLAHPPGLALLFNLCDGVERLAPESKALGWMYRLLLGIHLQKGHRAGLQLYANAPVAAPSM